MSNNKNKNNTPGVGANYEIYIPAHFALNLIYNKNVKDFSIRSNAEDFGNFDDVVIDITLEDGNSENYAIQLKHKQNKDKKLVPSNFEAKGDFHIEKYYKEFKNLSEEKKRIYHFIIYTNLEFNTQSNNESKLFNMLEIKHCQGREFFNTNSSDNAFYKFETKEDIPDKQDYDSFLPKVTLYTNQGDSDTIKNKILTFFAAEESQGLSYIDLFRNWHEGKFTNKIINRESVVFHLTNILLSKGMITDRYFLMKEKLKLFEEAVRLFNVTIIEGCVNDFLNKLQKEEILQGSPSQLIQLIQNLLKFKEEYLLRWAKDFKLVKKSTKKLKKNGKEIILSYFFRKLLIIDSRQVSNQSISKVTEFFRNKEDEIKLIVLCESAFTSLQCLVFQNLEDIRSKSEDLYNKITATCQVSLQAQDEISLCEFVKNFEDIGSSIETKDMFNILKDDCFLIGEEKETLPAYYIDRKFSITVLDFDSVVKCIKDENNIVIIDSQNLDKKQFNDNKIIVKTFREFLDATSNKEESKKQSSLIMSCDEENINKLFEEIVKQKLYKHVHYLKIIQDKFFLIKSTQNIFLSNNYSLEKMILDEKNINSILNGPINIICAEPGMGKTTTMNYLKNNCPKNFWSIGIDLKAHNSFLMNQHSFNDFLKHFLNSKEDNRFLKKLKEIFLQRKQIVFFFDGLDELESISVENILNHIKELSDKGFRVWVSSRQNLQSRLESTFNIFIVDIVELNQEEQKKIIEDRLKDRYQQDEIELLIKKISTNTRIINNQHFLGIPLQLYIITQIFLDQKFNIEDLKENMFVLTKMYRHFFEGRYEHFSSKLSSTNMREIEVYLEDYELIALQIIFDSEVLKKLDLDIRRSIRLLEKVKEEKDPLGIIVKLDKEGKPVFEHYTYAEYFVCSYLRNNFEKAKILKEQLFSDQYKNVMLILSIMLAEESPLHLAVIYKNHSEIEKHIENKTHFVVGGRNPFQVAVGLASCNIENKKNRLGHFNITDESIANKTIIKALITKFNPYEKDKLFEIDAFEYAVLRKNLFILEVILENFGMTHEAFVILKENNYIYNEMIAYASIKWNYPNLLAVALEKKNSYLVNKKNFSYYVAEYTSSATPHTIKLLKNYEIEARNESLLQKATKENNYELVKYLLVNVISVNKDLVTVAVKNKSWNVLKLLMEKMEYTIDDHDIIDIINYRQYEIADKIFKKQPELFSIARSNLVSLLNKSINNTDFEAVKYLLNLGVNLEYKNALHLAVLGNCTDIVKLILEKEPEKTENGQEETRIAVLNGNIEIVQLLPIDKRKDYKEQTLLHLASESGNIDLVKYIYNKIKGVNDKDIFGWTPICYAARDGYFEIFNFFVECEANINVSTNKRETLLHLASQSGNIEIVKYIYSKIKKVNDKDNNGWTPIFYAVIYKHFETFEFLVDCKANINVLTNDGETLLHFAGKGGNCEIIKYLLDKGLDKDAKDNKGKTPLNVAIENTQLNAVKYLISKGSEINISKEIWESFIKNGWIDAINLLVSQYGTDILNKELTSSELGVDVSGRTFKNLNGETPLALAIQFNQLEIAKYLLDHGANANDMRAFCEAATKKEDTRFLNLLFDKGFQLNKNSKNEQKLFELLIEDKNFQAINVLLSKNAQLNIEEIFWKSIECGELRTVEKCIKKGVNIDCLNRHEETPLLRSLTQETVDDDRKVEIATRLIREGADVNCISKYKKTIWRHLNWEKKYLLDLIFTNNVNVGLKDNYGKTPVDYAITNNKENVILPHLDKYNLKLLLHGVTTNNISLIQWFFHKGFGSQIKQDEEEIMPKVGTKNVEIVKLFLTNDLDINASNEKEETALFLAIKNQNIESAKYLISYNADVNCVTTNGETIWEHLDWNNKKFIEMIMFKEVYPELENSYGLTPLFYAIYYKDMNSVISLLSSDINVTKEIKLIGSIQTKNLEIFHLLEKKGLIATSNALRKYKDISLKISSAIEKIEDLYVRLHFAVYLGNITQVRNILRESIDLDSVDTYNSECPLHFAVKDNFLDSRLLIEKTKWIRSIYEKKKIWTIEDMRQYLIQGTPLNSRRCQFKYSYLTKEDYNVYINLLHPGLVTKENSG